MAALERLNARCRACVPSGTGVTVKEAASWEVAAAKSAKQSDLVPMLGSALGMAKTVLPDALWAEIASVVSCRCAAPGGWAAAGGEPGSADRHPVRAVSCDPVGAAAVRCGRMLRHDLLGRSEHAGRVEGFLHHGSTAAVEPQQRAFVESEMLTRQPGILMNRLHNRMLFPPASCWSPAYVHSPSTGWQGV